MTVGRALLILGVVIALAGLALEYAPALRIGKLPGDISFGGSNWRVYLPIGTSILLSVVLTLIFWLVGNFSRR